MKPTSIVSPGRSRESFATSAYASGVSISWGSCAPPFFFSFFFFSFFLSFGSLTPAQTASTPGVFVGTFFAGGVRLYDVRDADQPTEIAYYIPQAPPDSPAGAVQLNDVYVDENRLVYTVDRFAGGLYVLEMMI